MAKVAMMDKSGRVHQVDQSQVNRARQAGWKVVSADYWQPIKPTSSGTSAAGVGGMAGGGVPSYANTSMPMQQGAIGSAFGYTGGPNVTSQNMPGAGGASMADRILNTLTFGLYTQQQGDTPPSQTVAGQIMGATYLPIREDLVDPNEVQVSLSPSFYNVNPGERYTLNEREVNQLASELLVWYETPDGYAPGGLKPGMDETQAIERIMNYAQVSEKDAVAFLNNLKSLPVTDPNSLDYGLIGSGGGGGGGGASAPTYVGPDRRAVEESVKNQMVALIGTIESQSVKKVVDAYMRDHRKAWEGASLDPNMTMLEELRNLESYKKIHKLRPDSASEATWVAQHRNAWAQGGGRVGEAEDRAIDLATIGATASTDNTAIAEYGEGFETDTFRDRMRRAASVAVGQVA